ncbi:MAG: hypothetical protein FWH01_16335 [Oscillospiraceae bacterium]|nr:hypothetical protein [Oscillospiraceae bacterium]
MAILPPSCEVWNSLAKNFFGAPAALAGRGHCIYILIRRLSEALEAFILTGKPGDGALHVFDEKQERAIAGHWASLGLTVTYRSQQITYMNHTVTVKYLHVHNPTTNAGASLIPWFMRPGRPYPIFTYVYAVWHYLSTGEKSLSLSAAAAQKVFGVGRLNKSTVSRNMEAMARTIAMAGVDRPLAADGREAPPDEETIARVPQMLAGGPPAEGLGATRDAAAPAGGNAALRRALGGIPAELSKVEKGGGPGGGKARDGRKRGARPRAERKKPAQRIVRFVDSWQIERARIAFIGICRRAVLVAAEKYHRFLL